MAYETILSQTYHFAQKTVGLDSGARSYANGALNFDERTYEAIIADLATV